MTVTTPDEYLQHVARPSGVTRIVRGAGWTLVWFGLFLIGFVVHQLFITDFFASRSQAELETELVGRSVHLVEVAGFDAASGTVGEAVGDSGDVVSVDEFLPGDDLVLPAIESPGERLLLVEPIPARGEAVGRIRIPEIDVWWTAVEGVGRDELKHGPGHMRGTPLPGQPGNAVVSGHRTTYGAPFFDLDRLEPGAVIFWDSPVIGTTRYVVRESFVVEPDEVWVTEPLEGAWLTLTTCNPKYSARQRLIVRAEMLDGPNAAVIFGGTA